MSNSQHNKLKFWIKNGTEVSLTRRSILTGNSNDETNFLHTLLPTDTQVLRLPKVFSNGSSPSIKFSKFQLSMLIQSGRFNIFDLMNPAEAVYKIANKIKDLSNNMSLDDAMTISVVSTKTLSNPKNISGTEITLTSNEIYYEIMKVINSLENREILLQGTTRKITSQEGGFLKFCRPLMTQLVSH